MLTLGLLAWSWGYDGARTAIGSGLSWSQLGPFAMWGVIGLVVAFRRAQE